MRIAQDISRAKSAAKRLLALSSMGVRGTSSLSLSRAYDTMSVMLGYRDWHEFAGSRDKSDLLDHQIEPSQRWERRRQQSAALVLRGFSDEAAAAVVEVILPSGDFEHEMTAFSAFVDAHIRPLERLPTAEALDAAWMCHRFGLPNENLAWCTRVASVRASLDGGLVAAATKFKEQVSGKMAQDKGGYFAVISEPASFFQGYFLADPGPDAMAIMQSRLHEVLHVGDSAQKILRDMDGLIDSGFKAMPGSRIGAIQASLIRSAMEFPPEMTKIAAFGMLLSRETGFSHFVVRLEKELPRGVQTSVEELHVTNVDEARTAIAALPDVVRIKRALASRLKMPPGMPGI